MLAHASHYQFSAEQTLHDVYLCVCVSLRVLLSKAWCLMGGVWCVWLGEGERKPSRGATRMARAACLHHSQKISLTGNIRK